MGQIDHRLLVERFATSRIDAVGCLFGSVWLQFQISSFAFASDFDLAHNTFVLFRILSRTSMCFSLCIDISVLVSDLHAPYWFLYWPWFFILVACLQFLSRKGSRCWRVPFIESSLSICFKRLVIILLKFSFEWIYIKLYSS
jgi:hypothetical protein